MTKRYFKATDGKFTIFRASESRVYRGAWMRIDQSRRRAADGKTWEPFGEPVPVAMGFSAYPVPPHGQFPAVEIGKHEYQVLVQIKTARVEAWRAELRAKGQTMFGSIGPSDSWVRNDELPEWLYVGQTA